MNETEYENTDEDGIDSERALDRAVGTIEKQTVHKQPAFIPHYRLASIVGQPDGAMHDAPPGDRTPFEKALRKGIENHEILKVKLDGTKYYAYADAPRYLRAVAEAVSEWDELPLQTATAVEEWCENCLAELEAH